MHTLTFPANFTRFSIKGFFIMRTFTFALAIFFVWMGFSAQAAPPLVAGYPETFESGSKIAYATANVTLSTGSWNLNDALIGTLAQDRKNGSKSVRIQQSGRVRMNFDVQGGVSYVRIAYGVFGTDGASAFELWYSTNSGSSWTRFGQAVNVTAPSLQTTVFNVQISGQVRFEIRKVSGGANRINIDDFSLEVYQNVATRDNNMALGNPSNATTVVTNRTNYLMVKPQYTLSYNDIKKLPNWVSWHLSTAWKGDTPRQNDFRADETLPQSYYRVQTADYNGSGFDRGHLCPAEDRDGSVSDNSATFLMTNIIPQAPINNQQTWGDFEYFCRGLMYQGNELYIIAGHWGSGGIGSNGPQTVSQLPAGITVPGYVWKVAVVLPVGTNDVSRINTNTRVIAVWMPNTQTVNQRPWWEYRVSVDFIEAQTGYNFLSNVAPSIQNVIEMNPDSGPVF